MLKRSKGFWAIFLSLGGLLTAATSVAMAELKVAVFVSILLGIVMPVLLIAIRHQVRFNRLSTIGLFQENFLTTPRAQGGGGVTSIQSFEFVAGKYTYDIPGAWDGAKLDLSKVPATPFAIRGDWLILLCSLPFMAFSVAGVFVLLMPADIFGNVTTICGNSPNDTCKSTAKRLIDLRDYMPGSMLAVGGLPDPNYFRVESTLTIACIAFAGAYFFCLRLFLRAIANFDLSGLTFLRTFLHMVLAVLLAVMVWRAIPESLGSSSTAGQSTSEGAETVRQVAPASRAAAINNATTATEPVAGSAQASSYDEALDVANGRQMNQIWLLIAFMFGFIPDVAVGYLMQKSGLALKKIDNKLEAFTRIIPITIIDGIDHFAAFRLEEANIFDVQNLASANPILLFVETPYGIYECIDWVAQAQLCTAVGPERFLLLKRSNIRTIFDLERAILGSRLNASTPAARLIIANILYADNSGRAKVVGQFGLKQAEPQTTEDKPNTAPSVPDDETILHLVRVMMDDLHVYRLRQIWNHISEKLGPSAVMLDVDRFTFPQN